MTSLGQGHDCLRRFIGLDGGSTFALLPHWMRPGGSPKAASTWDGTNLTHLGLILRMGMSPRSAMRRTCGGLIAQARAISEMVARGRVSGSMAGDDCRGKVPDSPGFPFLIKSLTRADWIVPAYADSDRKRPFLNSPTHRSPGLSHRPDVGREGGKVCRAPGRYHPDRISTVRRSLC